MGKPYVGEDGVRRVDYESGPVLIKESEREPVIVCTSDEDRTRQEYKLQADISYQVARFGVGMHPAYGDQDFSMLDLDAALALVADSREAWARLPQAIRARYGSWAAVEHAAQTGELAQVMKAAGLTPAVGVGPDASASGSAPVPSAKGDSPS